MYGQRKTGYLLLAFTAGLGLGWMTLCLLFPRESLKAKTAPDLTTVFNSDQYRLDHVALLLDNGNVLIALGEGRNDIDVYQADLQCYTPIGRLDTLYQTSKAVLIQDRKLFVAGTCRDPPAGCYSVYDLQSKRTTISGMADNFARLSTTLTALPSGEILAVGGFLEVTINGSVEFAASSAATLYVPGNDKNIDVSKLEKGGRACHTATLTSLGTVLIIGGFKVNPGSHFECTEMCERAIEEYNPTTKKFSTVGYLGQGRSLHTAVLLPSGKLLISGGFIVNELPYNQSSSELCDTYTAECRATHPMMTTRSHHTSTLLANGNVLITGGLVKTRVEAHGRMPKRYSVTNTCEIYNQATGKYRYTSNLIKSRMYHRATLLTNGKVLITGGSQEDSADQGELFDPLNEQFIALTPCEMRHVTSAPLI